MTYSLLPLWQAVILFICKSVRVSLSAKEHALCNNCLLSLGLIKRKCLHTINIFTPSQPLKRNLFHLALQVVSYCSKATRLYSGITTFSASFKLIQPAVGFFCFVLVFFWGGRVWGFVVLFWFFFSLFFERRLRFSFFFMPYNSTSHIDQIIFTLSLDSRT